MNNTNINVYKNKAIDWFQKHKREIKIGVYCLAAGLVYGTVKGVMAGAEIESGHVNKLIEKIPDHKDYVNRLIEKIPDHTLHLPTGEQEITDWFVNIEDEDFDIVQRLIHESE